MRYLTPYTLASAFALISALLVGCGGGGSGWTDQRTGSIVLRIYWPVAGTRELPADTASVRVEVIPEEADFPPIVRVVTRPPGGGFTTVTLIGIPAGWATINVYAYDALGNLLATGASRVEVRAGQSASTAVATLPTYLGQFPLVFTRQEAGYRRVMLANAGGTCASLTAGLEQDCAHPAIPPYATYVIYESGGHLWETTIATLSTHQLSVLSSSRQWSPAFSPDGIRLAYVGAIEETGGPVNRVYIRVSGSEGWDSAVAGVPGAPREVAWAGPDQLLVVSAVAGEDQLLRFTLVEAEGYEAAQPITVVATGPVESMGRPTWNPITGSVAYLRDGALQAPGYPALAGVQSVSWLPDGSRLALSWAPSGQPLGIYLFLASETPILVVEPAGDDRDAAAPPAPPGTGDVGIVID